MADAAFFSGKLMSFAKGSHLFRFGEKSNCLFVIKKGAVRIYKNDGGVEVELDRCGAGGIVGEVAAIDDGPRTASVVATEATEAFMVSREELQNVIANIPDWFQKIAMILVKRLRDVDDKIDFSISTDKSSQIAALISLLANTSCAAMGEKGVEISLRTVENECIDVLSLPPSDVTLFLERLQKNGLISIEKNHVCIPDRARLDSFADVIFKQKQESFPT